MKERLQKIMSERGVASRRAAETMIAAGRVKVNGRVAKVGESADPEIDTVVVDGKRLSAKSADKIYIMLNKPAGYVSTLSDEEGRRDVSQLVKDAGVRVYPVGRLDINSTGLLLMTNDGELCRALTHPGTEVEKEYHVSVDGDVAAALPSMRSGVVIDGYRTRPAKAKIVRVYPEGDTLISVTIHEGRNRQIRKMCEVCGLHVRRLERVREGTLTMGELQRGKWRYLTKEEVQELMRKVK